MLSGRLAKLQLELQSRTGVAAGVRAARRRGGGEREWVDEGRVVGNRPGGQIQRVIDGGFDANRCRSGRAKALLAYLVRARSRFLAFGSEGIRIVDDDRSLGTRPFVACAASIRNAGGRARQRERQQQDVQNVRDSWVRHSARTLIQIIPICNHVRGRGRRSGQRARFARNESRLFAKA